MEFHPSCSCLIYASYSCCFLFLSYCCKFLQTKLQSSTKLKKILQESKDTVIESDIRNRLQPLKEQLASTISHLHSIFEYHVFIACCRGYWDKMGQVNKIYPNFFSSSLTTWLPHPYSLLTKSEIFILYFSVGCPELLRKQEREPGVVQRFQNCCICK